MSEKMRWRYGDTNLVVAAVDSATVIEIGDLLWQDTDDAKPASSMPANAAAVNKQVGYNKRHIVDADPPSVFAERFLGVATQRSCSGDTASVRVATTGGFEFECSLRAFELGDLVGAIRNDTGQLQDQAVGLVIDSKVAIARVAKREPTAVTSVLVDVRSSVMTGGIAGSSPSGV